MAVTDFFAVRTLVSHFYVVLRLVHVQDAACKLLLLHAKKKSVEASRSVEWNGYC